MGPAMGLWSGPSAGTGVIRARVSGPGNPAEVSGRVAVESQLVGGGVEEHGVARCLGHAVSAGEFAPQPLGGLGEQFWSDRRGAVADRSKGAATRRVGGRIIEQHGKHRGGQADHGDAPAPGLLPQERRLKALGEHHGPTCQVQRQHVVGRHVTQGERVQVGVGWTHRTAEQGGGRTSQQGGVGQHHAFGGAGGARRVDDPRRIARRGTGSRRGCVRLSGGGLLDGLVAKQFVDLEETPALWHEATLGEKFHHRVDQIGSADDQFGAHVLDHVCDLGGMQAPVGHRQHPSGPGHGAERQCHRGVVGCKHRHPPGRGDRIGHPGCQRQRGAVPLGEGPTAVATCQRRGVGRVA